MDAKSIASGLRGGQRMGRYWMALCPAHRDSDRSLSISDGHSGVVVHCHAGCSQEAVIDELRNLRLWPDKKYLSERPRFDKKKLIEEDTLSRSEGALRVWYEHKPWKGTLVETYLRSRGINHVFPQNIGFHPALKHPTGVKLPGMVALVVTVDDVAIGVHRTFLREDGLGKAEVEPNKMLLGPARGGVVKLYPYHGVLMVGEGIETCLSAMQLYRHAAWAAISAPNLKTLCLPPDVINKAVLVDRDRAGVAAATAAAERWRADLWYPPNGGEDFNDALAAA